MKTEAQLKRNPPAWIQAARLCLLLLAIACIIVSSPLKEHLVFCLMLGMAFYEFLSMATVYYYQGPPPPGPSEQNFVKFKICSPNLETMAKFRMRPRDGKAYITRTELARAARKPWDIYITPGDDIYHVRTYHILEGTYIENDFRGQWIPALLMLSTPVICNLPLQLYMKLILLATVIFLRNRLVEGKL